jgi:twitching motility protein PilT
VPGLERLQPQHTAAIASLLLGQQKAATESFETWGSADLSYSLPGSSRFRVNLFKQRGTTAIVMRVIPNTVPSFDDLLLPPQLAEVTKLKNGIVLVTGPTGSGKSSTLAAIVDLINQNYRYHIVTIEDPIEFLHTHKQSTIHQRELHTDTPDFAHALRAALRQAPKVILVGEMRDLETVEVALEAAETGHLVLSTLHTIDAAKTIERIVGIFPKSQEQTIRMRLGAAFQYIVSQRLIPRANGAGRVAAIEILKSTMRTRDYVQKGESDGRSLLDAMRQGDADGMQDFDSVIERLIRDGVVTEDDGLAYATNRHNLQLQLSDFGSSSPEPWPAAERPVTPLRVAGDTGGSILDLIER